MRLRGPPQVRSCRPKITSEVDPGSHADIGMSELIGDPGNGQVGLVEERGDRSSKRMRYCPGEVGSSSAAWTALLANTPLSTA